MKSATLQSFIYESIIANRFLAVLLCLVLSSCLLKANMASPWRNGGYPSEAYTSQHIDILNEQLTIEVLSPYEAFFKVTYFIYSSQEGKKIPMVFDTLFSKYEESNENDSSLFRVWLDGIEVPVSFLTRDGLDNSFIDSIQSTLQLEKQMVYNDEIHLAGRRYFELDLSEGEHIVYVEYKAQSAIYTGDWVQMFDFSYNLEPARHWRSFGGLDLVIKVHQPAQMDCRFYLAEKHTYYHSSDDNFIQIDSIYSTRFEEIPADKLVIVCKPSIPSLAKTAIRVGPVGLMGFFFLLFMALHIYLIHWYRKKGNTRFSWIVPVGSLIIPLACFILFLLAFHWIDLLIGDYASGSHGYIFLIFFTYPFVLVPYWLFSYLLDFMIKNHYKKQRSL